MSKSWKRIVAHALKTTTKLDRLKNSVLDLGKKFLDSKHVLKVYFKPSRKNSDFGFLPLPSEPDWLKNYHLIYLLAPEWHFLSVGMSNFILKSFCLLIKKVCNVTLSLDKHKGNWKRRKFIIELLFFCKSYQDKNILNIPDSSVNYQLILHFVLHTLPSA